MEPAEVAEIRYEARQGIITLIDAKIAERKAQVQEGGVSVTYTILRAEIAALQEVKLAIIEGK